MFQVFQDNCRFITKPILEINIFFFLTILVIKKAETGMKRKAMFLHWVVAVNKPNFLTMHYTD